MTEFTVRGETLPEPMPDLFGTGEVHMVSRLLPRNTGEDLPGDFTRAARLARLVCHADAHPARSLFSAGVWTLYDFAGRYIAEVTKDGLVTQKGPPSAVPRTELAAYGSARRRTAFFRCPVCGDHYAAPDFDGPAHAATCLGASISLLELVPAFVAEQED